MKKTVRFWVLGVLGVLVVGGCASNQSVKNDEALVPAAAKQTTVTDLKSANKASESLATTGATTKQTKENVQTNMNQPAMGQMKSALEKIYFDFDSDGLSEQSRNTLATNADYLKKHSNVTVRIEGNCDERGSAEYNIALGEKRAKAAMKYLSTMGIAENRLSIISYGKEKPADPGHDETAWAKNRRDDFIILSK